jgi:hypothetical protein
VSGRHPDVDERKLRLVLAYQPEQLRAIAALTDDIEARALAQAREPFTQENFVLRQHDACSLAAHTSKYSTCRC